METKIKEKITFLEQVLTEIEKEYNSLDSITKALRNDYDLEILIINSQIKVLKQLLNGK